MSAARTAAPVLRRGRTGTRVKAAVLVVLALAAGVAGLVAGPAVTTADVAEVFAGGGDPLARHIVLNLRLPRALVALTAGACLALAGLVLQSALRNPLAGPEVTGVTPGRCSGRSPRPGSAWPAGSRRPPWWWPPASVAAPGPGCSGCSPGGSGATPNRPPCTASWSPPC